MPLRFVCQIRVLVSRRTYEQSEGLISEAILAGFIEKIGGTWLLRDRV